MREIICEQQPVHTFGPEAISGFIVENNALQIFCNQSRRQSFEQR
jgi:hypothetical protein